MTTEVSTASFAYRVRPQRRFTAASLLRLALGLLLLSTLVLGVAPAGLVAPTTPAGPTTLNPALLPQIEAATFEVVAAKPKDTLKYAQPLPLNLLPYQERADKYYSIGTAFAIGPNEFVTAGHVLMTGNQSLWGPPELRDAKGQVYAIDKIEKFALRRDFMVFSLKDPPRVTPLAADVHPAVNQPVYSVDNAEGTGVVIRNGLYTSNTPENQSGAWNWIRFSAPASPGNSGGPLLNQQGQVIGVVLMKSPDETLNYALPISQVLDAPDNVARYDKRGGIHFPLMHTVRTVTFKGDFPLPATLPAFFTAYDTALTAVNEKELQALLDQQHAQLFPNGSGAQRILNVGAPPDRLPHFLGRATSGDWIPIGKPGKKTPLAANGYVVFGHMGNGALVHLRRPDDIPATQFYDDPERVMDSIAKTGFMIRTIAKQKIAITSFGAPASTSQWTDRWGRRWQIWAWPIPFANQYLTVGALPVPDGYSLFFFGGPTEMLQTNLNLARALTNFVTVSYVGTLAQWKEFLADSPLLPNAFKDIRIAFDYGKDFRYEGPRAELSITPRLQKIQPDSTLWLGFSFFHSNRANKVVWNVSEVGLEDGPSAQHWSWVVRHNAPPAGIGMNFQDTWSKIVKGEQPYDAVASGNGSGGTVIRGIVARAAGGPNASVLYTAYINQPGTQLQATMKQKLDLLLRGIKLIAAQ